MVFSSSTFLVFFLPAVLLGYYIIHPRLRNPFLLAASLFFYAWGEPKFVLVMLLSILCNYLFARRIDQRRKRNLDGKLQLIAAVIFNIGLLIVFKYTNFLTYNLSRVFRGIAVTHIALPIGISFFTFQALSYVVDVYRGEEVQKNPLDLGLYISFFPQLIAGPIVRYRTIAAQLHERSESWDGFSEGTERFLVGLFKKIILANNLSLLADAAFAASPSEISVCFSWLGALAYTFQIYYDFSGYSDMAIGLGKMFGFQFLENFNYPYIAQSVTDFWRRWHISLSSWFRDYVYFPLGGSHVSTKSKHIRNLLVVWLLTGIWHGASWNFVLWGLVYFFLLVLEKFVVKPENIRSRTGKLCYRLFTFLAVMLCWVLFRAEGLQGAAGYFRSMLGLCSNPFVDANVRFYAREYLVLLILAAVFSTPILSKLASRFENGRHKVLFGVLKAIAFVGLLFISLSYLVMGAHNPFIYFNF